ncbi:MAG TPA: phosphoenolpyruvate carboxykinase (ATP), partial [candidate division WOR-3 bacterium]|nr:phosphoenolpyruvate carboxykinase (ATP) [candidate division WOR-3 bacterium]
AGYFMLGETSKTSAAGKERGKTRSPFTQPFFPRVHRLQAERFQELAAKNPGLVNWMMNTGYVGGDALDEKEGRALKVKIKHSSAMLEYMFLDKIKWTEDPDFGYEIVDINHPANKELMDKVPPEILNPRLFYEKTGRLNEYREWVQRMKKEREEFLRKHGVKEEIIKAVLNIK